MLTYNDIIEIRKNNGISQSKLAELAGFSKSQISSWELGKKIPTEENLKLLKSILEKTINEIKSGESDIRKKRITVSSKKRVSLPTIIKSADEYIKLLKKNNTTNTPYKNILSNLYCRSMSGKNSEAPKAIALFAGCGGLSLGFSAQGFKLVGHVEIESSANAIYDANFKESVLLGTDIKAISDKELKRWKSEYGEIDVIIGGPPCQGFSLAGKRDSYDVRNQLYLYYVHLVSIIKPKAFVMENVKLLTSMKTPDGRLFIDCIEDEFSKVGYTLEKKVLNASDFGIPQSRERIFIVGVRADLNKKFRFPKSNDALEDGNLSQSARSFRDATLDLCTLESGESSKDPLHWSVCHPEHVIKWLEGVPEGESAHNNKEPELRPPSGFNTTYKRIKWDEPCSTISTNFSMISGCRNVHPTSTRSLTIREAARSQSFPDEFIFTGKWGDIRKAIGNAVPPMLAEVIAKALKTQVLD